MVFVVTAIVGTCAFLVRPRHALVLADQLSVRTVLLAVLGTALEIWGMQLDVALGYPVTVLGLIALLAAVWSLRHWPGGWLLLLGLALNAAAIAAYGRMPIAPEVLGRLGLTYPVGMLLPGSKDVVAEGWIARWLGDRFILTLPLVSHTSVWSLGDFLLLAGVGWGATGRVHNDRPHLQRSPR